MKDLSLTRKQTADYLHITIDTLRNWKLNGLLMVKRKQNGYRLYTEIDINRLIIIKALGCANYSLSAILRMFHTTAEDPRVNIRIAIEVTSSDEDIISACDRLITSLNHAKKNMEKIQTSIESIIRSEVIDKPLGR